MLAAINAGPIVAECEQASRNTCVWLTPTRAQRDDALHAPRGIVDDPLRVTSIGRTSDAAVVDGEVCLFDEHVGLELQTR